MCSHGEEIGLATRTQDVGRRACVKRELHKRAREPGLFRKKREERQLLRRSVDAQIQVASLKQDSCGRVERTALPAPAQGKCFSASLARETRFRSSSARGSRNTLQKVYTITG